MVRGICSVLVLAAVLMPCGAMQLRSKKQDDDVKKYLMRNFGSNLRANLDEKVRVQGDSDTSVILGEDSVLATCPMGNSKTLTVSASSTCEATVAANSECGDVYAESTSDCTCCQPLSKGNCMTCTPGGTTTCYTCTTGASGWQVGPKIEAGGNYSVKRILSADNKPASCNMEARNGWSAGAAYRLGVIGDWMPWFFNYEFMMQSASWVYTKSWIWVNATSQAQGNYDSDGVGLWTKGDECILAFRGSDTQTDMLNDQNDGPTTYKTIPGVSLGLTYEMDVLVGLLADGGYDLIRETCGTLTVTGHSLGGAIAQLFAALANKQGDPLGADLTVDAVYLYAGEAVSVVPVTNDKSSDGCFPGMLYINAIRPQDGGLVTLDKGGMWGTPTLHHGSIKKTLLYGPGDADPPLGCKEPFPEFQNTPTLAPWHNINTYTDNLAC